MFISSASEQEYTTIRVALAKKFYHAFHLLYGIDFAGVSCEGRDANPLLEGFFLAYGRGQQAERTACRGEDGCEIECYGVA